MNRLLTELFPLYELYHKNQRSLVSEDAIDESTVSETWTTGEYKEYGRLGKVSPSDSFDVERDEVLSTLSDRASFTDATTPRPVTRDELFMILASGYAVNPATDTRPVASAGRLYPLEVYPIVLDSSDIDGGLYHYQPDANVLERPADPDYIADRFGPLDEFVAAHWAHLHHDDEISAMFIITALPRRSVAKYGERGYLFSLIEVGAVIQAFQLAGASIDVGTRPYAGFNFDAVSELLGLRDDPEEFVLVSLALANSE